MSRKKNVRVIVYGAGGHAREVAWLIGECRTSMGPLSVVAFVDDRVERQNQCVNDVPVMSIVETRTRFPDARLVVAIGDPHSRETLVRRCEELGFSFLSLVHPRTERSRWVTMGDGVVICAGNILTTNINLGNHVHVNTGCTIAHDVAIGDFTTVSPGVHIAGRVRIGRRAYIGIGASIINGNEEKPLLIGNDVVIGAQACVTRDIHDGYTVVGVPAKPLVRKSTPQ